MKKTLIEIYALIVCLIVIIVLLVNLHTTVFNIVQAINPRMTLASCELKHYGTNEEFTSSWSDEKLNKYSPDEIAKMREHALENVLVNGRIKAINDVIAAVIYLVISALFFLIHWKLAKKERQQNT